MAETGEEGHYRVDVAVLDRLQALMGRVVTRALKSLGGKLDIFAQALRFCHRACEIWARASAPSDLRIFCLAGMILGIKTVKRSFAVEELVRAFAEAYGVN